MPTSTPFDLAELLLELQRASAPGPGRDLAEERLLARFGRMVNSLAGRYRAAGELVGLDGEDLAQEGHLALLAAARGFDHRPGSSFTGYAFTRCSWAMLRAIELARPAGCRGGQGRLPAVRSIDVAPGEDPDAELLAEALRAPEDGPSAERLAIDGAALRSAIERLPRRLRMVIVERYGLASGEMVTQEQLAGRLGVTKQLVSRIEFRAVRALRRVLGVTVRELEEAEGLALAPCGGCHPPPEPGPRDMTPVPEAPESLRSGPGASPRPGGP